MVTDLYIALIDLIRSRYVPALDRIRNCTSDLWDRWQSVTQQVLCRPTRKTNGCVMGGTLLRVWTQAS